MSLMKDQMGAKTKEAIKQLSMAASSFKKVKN